MGQLQSMAAEVKARKATEERLHDPVIMEHIDALTDERRGEFQKYLCGEYAGG